MSTAVGTIAINAAFLQEIKEDNHELAELLDKAAQAFAAGRELHSPPRLLVDLLGRLRDQLATHFSLEEAFGYFEDATAVSPHLSRQAETLKNEHLSLFRSLCDLVEEAEQFLYHEKAGGLTRHISPRFRDFYRQLRDHETRENELILDSLDCDIGVGD